jgi:hypothetical protein
MDESMVHRLAFTITRRDPRKRRYSITGESLHGCSAELALVAFFLGFLFLGVFLSGHGEFLRQLTDSGRNRVFLILIHLSSSD